MDFKSYVGGNFIKFNKIINSVVKAKTLEKNNEKTLKNVIFRIFFLTFPRIVFASADNLKRIFKKYVFLFCE